MVEEFLRKQPRAGRRSRQRRSAWRAGNRRPGRARNVGWRVDGRELAVALGPRPRPAVQRLVAIAHSVAVLDTQELHMLQDGEPNLSGNAALHRRRDRARPVVPVQRRAPPRPAPSESGHADFAARTPRELGSRPGWRRATAAQRWNVVSGLGLSNLYHFTHPFRALAARAACTSPPDTRNAVGTCAHCREALDIFVAAYGAEAGNLALRAVTTRGIYIGGGIAPAHPARAGVRRVPARVPRQVSDGRDHGDHPGQSDSESAIGIARRGDGGKRAGA